MPVSSECITQLILSDIRDLCKSLFAQFLYQAQTVRNANETFTFPPEVAQKQIYFGLLFTACET